MYNLLFDEAVSYFSIALISSYKASKIMYLVPDEL